MKNTYSLDYYVQRIAHFLKGIRLRKKLTQTEIARTIKVSVSSISRLESQKLDSMNLENLLRMSNLANMTLSSFFLYLEENFDHQGDYLAPWQKDTIESLAKLKTKTRLLFIKKVLIESSSHKQELLFSLLNEFSDLEDQAIEKLFDFVKIMKHID